jgi:Arc/MetJ family transcription regulator
MPKRLTVELDEGLLERAKRTLGQPTTRATIEEALRRAVEDADADRKERAARQAEYLSTLADGLDLDVLESDEMWR